MKLFFQCNQFTFVRGQASLRLETICLKDTFFYTAKSGIRAKRMRSQFPTKSYPNLRTIVTVSGFPFCLITKYNL